MVRAKLPALVSVFYSNGKSGFGSAVGRPWNTNSAPYQGAQHGKEPAVVAGNGAGKLARFIHAGKPVQHVFFGYCYLIKIDHSIVHTVQAHLRTAIFYGNAFHRFTLLITYGHKKSVDSVIFTLQNQFGKNRSHLPV